MIISYSQNAEDIRLRRAFGAQSTGFYVDVGAYHPENCSLTKHFYDLGWRGLNLEPSPASFERVQRARLRDVNIQAGAANARGTLTFYEFAAADGLNTFSPEIAEHHGRGGRPYRRIEIAVVPLAELLEKHAPAVIDFMNVDVEGFEAEVLQGADLARFRPRVLIIESTLPLSNSPAYTTWERLVLDAGYLFATFDGLNRFYVRHEDTALIEPLSVPPSTLDDFIPHHFEQQLAALRGELRTLNDSNRSLLVRGARLADAWVRRGLSLVRSGSSERRSARSA